MIKLILLLLTIIALGFTFLCAYLYAIGYSRKGRYNEQNGWDDIGGTSFYITLILAGITIFSLFF